MAHNHVLTTFCSYGDVPAARQAELIRGATAVPDTGASHLAQILRKMADELDGGRRS